MIGRIGKFCESVSAQSHCISKLVTRFSTRPTVRLVSSARRARYFTFLNLRDLRFEIQGNTFNIHVHTDRPFFEKTYINNMIVKPIAQAACLLLSATNNRCSSTQLWSHQNEEIHPNRRLVLKALGYAPAVVVASIQCTTTASALTPDEASVAYDSYAANYDALDGGKASSALGLDDARADLFGKAKGKVLEIGVGTGLNLAKYDMNRVSSLTVVDISEGMIQEARTRTDLLNLGIPVEFVKADATSELTEIFGADSFDTVVDSFSLCVMGNEGARRCLEQMITVVKPSTGRVLLLENSRSSSAALGWYQDVTANAAAMAGGKGCVYNQDVASMILGAKGLTIENEKAFVAGLFRSFECVKNR